MRKIYFILILLSTVLYTYAQETETESRKDNEFKTIFGGKKIGGYGNIGVGYTIIDNDPAVSFDARGGIVMGHWFAIGIGGGSYIGTYQYNAAHSTDISLTGGYGGVFGEIIIFPKSKIHLSFPVLIGIGGAAVSTRFYTNSNSEVINNVEETSIHTIIEPSVELEFNLTKFMRTALFFSYRYTSDVDFDSTWEIEPDALIGYSAGLRLKFGKF